MKIKTARLGARFGALLILLALALPVVAQTYPNGPVHIIVPYSAGGLADALARTVGAKVSEALGVPVIVEDRPGASSIIGMEACANAKSDGRDSLSHQLPTASPTIRNFSPSCRTMSGQELRTSGPLGMDQ